MATKKFEILVLNQISQIGLKHDCHSEGMKMAKCPRCRAKQDYSSLLFLGGNKTLVCKQCGASLRLNKWRLLPFALVVNAVAAFIGLTMIVSKAYMAMLIVLCIWILISLAVYPLVVSVRVSNDPQT